jgi:PAS domain S-box-containing protein
MNFRFYRPLLPYVVAIAATGAAILLTLWLEPLLTRTIGAFFYLAVIFSSWYGGIRPGIVAIVLSTLAINYFFIPPIRQLAIQNIGDLLRLAIFLLVAFSISWLNNDLRHNKRKVEQLSQRLLQENAEQLRMALASARMGMWDWNLLTGEIIWSPEHEQLLGLAPGSFDGRYSTFDDRLYPDDRDGLLRVVERSRRDRTVYQHEFRVIWTDGSIHWIEGRGQFFYDASGQPVRMTGTVMDIDQRKHTEIALKQSEQQLRAILDAEPECVKVISTDGILQTINPVGLTMLESDSLEQVLGLCVVPLIDPAYRQQFLEFTQAAANDKPGILEFEMVGLKGTRRWLESHAVPIKISQAAITHVLSVTRDITDRKRAEAELQQAKAELELRVAERTAELTQTNALLQTELKKREEVEAALRQSAAEIQDLYDNAPCGYHSLDSGGKFIQINNTELEWLGYRREEIIGKKFTDVITPDSLPVFQANFPKFKQ